MLRTVQERKGFRRRHRSSHTRQRVIAAALRLFARDGFRRTTIRDIAWEAGITDAAIYYHFAKKDELLTEVLNSQLRPAARNKENSHDAGCPSLAHALAQEAAGMIEANHQLFKIILREGLAGDPVAVERYDRLLDAWQGRLEDCLEPLETAGMLPSGEGKSMARQIALTTMIAFEDVFLLGRGRSNSHTEQILEARHALTLQIGWLLTSCVGPSAPQTRGGLALTDHRREPS